MRTPVLDKLIKIAREIEDSGTASLTRLTVLKKWFEQDPKRLTSFAVFVARQGLAEEGKISEEEAALFHDAEKLLNETAVYDPKLDRDAAEKLYRRLRDFQSEYKKQQWCQVRIIHDLSLFLIEDAIRIYLQRIGSPSDGYRLAAAYCQNFDSKYGNTLNGPSLNKINAIVGFAGFIDEIENSVDHLTFHG